MGNKKSGQKIYSIDGEFFKHWNSITANILGFTSADGNVWIDRIKSSKRQLTYVE